MKGAVTVVMADPPAGAAEALAAAGHVVSVAGGAVAGALSDAHRSSDGRPLVLWGAGARGGEMLRIAAVEGGVDGVIAVAPHVDPLGAAIAGARAGLRERPAAVLNDLGRVAALARAPRPVRLAARIMCPVLIQVADEDDANPPDAAMKAAWRAGADVRHYPCDEAEMLAPGTIERVLEHQLGFLRQRIGPHPAGGDQAS
jgi:hypothetical protein